LCGTQTDTVLEGVDTLAKASSSLSAQAEQSESASKSYLLEIEKDADEKLRACERQIWKTQTHLQQLGLGQSEVRSYQDSEKAAARLVGKIEQLLELASTSTTMTGLAAKKTELEAKVTALKHKYDFTKKGERTRKTMSRVSAAMTGHAEALALEWRDSRPSIDLTHLAVCFSITEDAKKTFLSELGSGENWMGYHLAAFLSLHEVFSHRAEACPVPSFLIIDQPTQVYFPANIDAYEQRKVLNLDNDVEKAKNIFRVLGNATANSSNAPQIIVTDHADKDTWGECGVHEVANWRGVGADSHLVPVTWLDNSAAGGDHRD
jgi:hypothetical protein